jgi:hypothetical protein
MILKVICKNEGREFLQQANWYFDIATKVYCTEQNILKKETL